MDQTQGTQRFEMWAIVDVMGHQRYAGFVTEQTIAGAGFIRVDVPEVERQRAAWQGGGTETLPGFQKLLATGSIHSMTPCTEAVARAAAASIHVRPLQGIDLPKATPQLTAAVDVRDDEGIVFGGDEEDED